MLGRISANPLLGKLTRAHRPAQHEQAARGDPATRHSSRRARPESAQRSRLSGKRWRDYLLPIVAGFPGVDEFLDGSVFCATASERLKEFVEFSLSLCLQILRDRLFARCRIGMIGECDRSGEFLVIGQAMKIQRTDP